MWGIITIPKAVGVELDEGREIVEFVVEKYIN